MWLTDFILQITKVTFGFLGLLQILKLLLFPGFTKLEFEGKRLGKNILIPNILLLLLFVGIYLAMGMFGIKFLS